MAVASLRFFLPALVLTALLPVCAPTVHAAPTTIEGIHIRLSGTAPHFKDAATTTLTTYETQCRAMKSVCAMMPAGAGAKEKAMCAGVQSRFQLRGNIADVGTQETDQYFAMSPQMAARKITRRVLKVRSICDVEVVDDISHEIWHYTANGYIHFALKDKPGRGRYWLRTEHRQARRAAGGLVTGVLPLPDASNVSAATGHQTIAGHKCEVRDVSGPWSGTLCLKPTASAFPGQVTLAGKITAGNHVMLDEEATSLSERVMLPRAVFYPPEHDRIQKSQSTAAPHASAARCVTHEREPGVDPCSQGGAS